MVEIISEECHVDMPYPPIEYMEEEVKKDYGGEMPDFDTIDVDAFTRYYENKMIALRGASGLYLIKGRVRYVYAVYNFFFFGMRVLKHRYWMPIQTEGVPKYVNFPVKMKI